MVSIRIQICPILCLDYDFLKLILLCHNDCVSGKATVVYNALKTASQTANFSVYRPSDLPPRWHYGQSPCTPPLLAVANIGYAFHDLTEWNQKWFQQKFNKTCKNTQTVPARG